MKLFGSTFLRKKNKNRGKSTEEELFQQQDITKYYSRQVDENKKHLGELFKGTFDFKCESIKIGGLKGYITYISTMINKNELSNRVLQAATNRQTDQSFRDMVEMRELYFPSIDYKVSKNFHQVVWSVLNGEVVIMVDGYMEALTLDIGLPQQRAISEPSTQTIIRGPKEGFVEALPVNIQLVRKRLKNPRLRFEVFQIGSDSKTNVALGYINDIVNEDLLCEVRERINKVDVGALLDSGNVEEFIADKSFTPFPLVYNTERPDSVCGHLLEGKMAIIVDGSPFVLTVPTLFVDFFQASEDYYQPFIMASFVRMVRYSSFMIALLLPSLYVAISTFHHELMPTQLLISIQAQREGVPFPAVIEIMIMELSFEVLREAGVRMPRVVGQTVSIVGALVIGQAAVEAGLVSNVLVIVVAFTAIASFVSPIYNFSIATRLLRFVVIFSASFMGLYGVLLFLIMMVIHLVSLRSFGIPYLAPVAPFRPKDQDDVFIRMPIWKNKKRPSYLYPKTPVRIKDQYKPGPPKPMGDQR
ncbi:spore germination protein [Robertmurraya korlensis]|uniref:spore germination protein n=1 Tax=Robertmurraya korlensis TaxID=519977 RepID=UPI0008247F11|nr:spore germination protein [Robertmurraya korlensis]